MSSSFRVRQIELAWDWPPGLERLIGVCGLNRDPFLSQPRLDADPPAAPRVARLRRLYVEPQERRRGVGGCLVQAALDRARGHFQLVRLRTRDARAEAFYRSQGFGPVEDENATHQRVP